MCDFIMIKILFLTFRFPKFEMLICALLFVMARREKFTKTIQMSQVTSDQDYELFKTM